ncbi:hypothetical protein AGLY_014286 [Aphis glycines]|uniref:Uncharacterized protein n=1 Tax=Aphis glycines TaxID=307491 RepID=A0A6G0T478_APHGL|nr:hypothetical protein AGLY_014286 [Aphis glycines]
MNTEQLYESSEVRTNEVRINEIGTTSLDRFVPNKQTDDDMMCQQCCFNFIKSSSHNIDNVPSSQTLIDSYGKVAIGTYLLNIMLILEYNTITQTHSYFHFKNVQNNEAIVAIPTCVAPSYITSRLRLTPLVKNYESTYYSIMCLDSKSSIRTISPFIMFLPSNFIIGRITPIFKLMQLKVFCINSINLLCYALVRWRQDMQVLCPLILNFNT